MKKVLLLILALTFCIGCFSGCDSFSKGTTEETNASKDTSAKQDEETLDPNYVSDLSANLNFGNEVVGIICTNQDLRAEEFASEEGEGIAQSSYQRNVQVEDRLGVILDITTLTYDGDENQVNKVVATMVDTQATENNYNILTAPSFRATLYATNGYYKNLYDLDNLDLEKYYWSQGFNDVLSFGGTTQYLATGSFAISLYRSMFVTVVNTEMFETYSQESIYKTVDDGNWTIENQYEIAKAFYDEGASTENQIYGLAAGYKICIDPYWVSFDIPLISKDSETDTFVNNFTNKTMTAKLSTAVDKIQKLFNSDYVTLTKYDDDGTECIPAEVFCEQKAAMATTICYGIEKNLNDFQDLKYAVVPMPKYDTDQKEYITCVQDQVSVIGVASNVSDDKLGIYGAVLECIAEESYTSIVPDYYENRLCLRFTQDPDSQRMMKMIYEGSTIGIGAAYSGCAVSILTTGYSTMLRNLIPGSTNTVSSSIRQYQSGLKQFVNKLNGEG